MANYNQQFDITPNIKTIIFGDTQVEFSILVLSKPSEQQSFPVGTLMWYGHVNSYKHLGYVGCRHRPGQHLGLYYLRL